MAAAEAAGEEYQAVFDPPAADPSLCHPETTCPTGKRRGEGVVRPTIVNIGCARPTAGVSLDGPTPAP